MIERVTNYREFKHSSDFSLKPGRLYKVDVPRLIKQYGSGFELRMEDGRQVVPEAGEIVLCVSKPEKIVVRVPNADIHFIQYWRVLFVAQEKIACYSVLRSPLDLREFNYEANLRLLQVS